MRCPFVRAFFIPRCPVSEYRLCVAAKGEFIRDQGMLGFAMWEAGGDYNDILLDSITAAAKCGS
jgi:GH18 family chitinase